MKKLLLLLLCSWFNAFAFVPPHVDILWWGNYPEGASAQPLVALAYQVASQNGTALSNIGACFETSHTDTTFDGYCIYNPNNNHLPSAVMAHPSSSCPINSFGTTTSGVTTCTCSTGFMEDSSHTSCISAAAANAAIVAGLNLVGAPVVGAGGGLSFCYGGASVVASGSAYNPADPTGVTNYIGPFSVGTGSCTGVTDAAKPLGSAACKSNEYFGQVNGVDKCIAGTSVSTSSSTVAPASGASGVAPSLGGNAPSGAVSSSVTTTCAAGGCDTVTNYYGSGGALLGSSTVSGPPKAGDVPTKSQCELTPSAVGCSEFGTPDAPVLSKIESGFSAITPVAFTSSASCPSDLVMSVLGHSYAVSYSGACSALDTYIKPLLLLLSVALSGWIFVGGFKV